VPLSGERSIPARLNRLVDRALMGQRLPVWPLLRIHGGPQRLAERIRRRATSVARRTPGPTEPLIERRDRLMQAVYAQAAATPLVAWCDASWRPGSDVVGAAALVSGAGGRTLSTIQKHSPSGADSVAAEALAVTLAIEWVLNGRGDALTAYSDSTALVKMWREKRNDPRLNGLRKTAGRLRFFRLLLIRRTHNQRAHRLARAALSGAGPGFGCRDGGS
jgi:ribonuclease HI